MTPLEFHTVADLFPLMEGAAYDALKADIAANGQREPIRLYGGRVLDGRNRYRACAELGIEPAVAVWDGPDPVSFVVSLNLRRRHLTESQRAMVAARLTADPATAQICAVGPEGPSDPGTAQICAAPVSDPAAAQICAVPATRAADMLNVSRRSVVSARKVAADGVSSLAAAVDSGTVSVSAAAEVAGLPPAEQAAVVAAGPAAVKERAAELRSGRSRVNGVAAADPPDVAAARANGKIAPGVVVEVTEPDAGAPADGPAQAPEPEPAELTDEEWLATLPARASLDGAQLKTFDADATLYRDLNGPRKTFAHHASRALNKARRKGEYAYRVGRFLKTDHPKHWPVCPAVTDGGCAGTGQVPLIGACPKCRGKGYWIK